MPFREMGAFLLLLTAVFFFGNFWFHAVEAAAGRIRRLFARRKQPPAWHTLPSDKEERKND